MKEWGIIRVLGFNDKPVWILSSRKISDEDVSALNKMQIYKVDLAPYGFGYEKSGMHFLEIVRVGCTKEKAQEITDKLNNGCNPFSLMLGESFKCEEDGND